MRKVSILSVTCIVVLFNLCSGRNIARYGPSSNVNLVEFNIRGVVYGKCVCTTPEGEKISVVYEEEGKNLKAKSTNPTVVDPLAGVQQCRKAAISPSSSAPQLEGRSEMGRLSSSPQELYHQFLDFNNQMSENLEFVSHLQPRFLGSLFGFGGSNQPVGISFEKGGGGGMNNHEYETSSSSSSFFPTIHFKADQFPFSKLNMMQNQQTSGVGTILGQEHH